MERKIDEYFGDLDKAINYLLAAKARGEHVYCEFNGHELHSDTVSMDSAYIEVTGHTKEEYDKMVEESIENFEKERKIAEQKAKDNIPVWVEKGQKLIFPEKYENWEKLVQSRAADIYHGSDLDAALEIMEALNKGVSIEEVKEIFAGQNHSGASAGVVRHIIFNYSSRGPEFWEATTYGEITPEEREILEMKREENLQLAELQNKKDENSKHL